MKRLAGALIVAPALWLGAAAVLAEVAVDRDPAVDFTGYRTFAWRGGTPASDPLLEKRFRVAVERELVAKGLKEVRDAPDLLVVTHAAVEAGRGIELGDYPYWQAYRGWRRAVEAGGETRELAAGTVIVDLLDGHTEALVWRGVGTEIAAKTPVKRDEKLGEAAAKMFRRFPPK